MPNLETAAPITWKVRVHRGLANLSSPARGSLRVRYAGVCVTEHAKAVTRLLKQWLEEGLEVVVTIDALDLEACDHGFGRHWHRWLEANRALLQAFEVLSLAHIDALSAEQIAA